MALAINLLDLEAARTASVEGLGLPSGMFAIDDAETLAAALRRAASFLCPATSARIVRAVTGGLEGLVDSKPELREQLNELLQALIGYGDLLELPERKEVDAGLLLYLGSPGFVRRDSGACLLIGVRPEAEPLLGEDILPLVEYRRHVRTIAGDNDQHVDALLIDYGLREMSREHWLNCPPAGSPEDLVRDLEARLNAAGASGLVEGLRILDPNTSVTHYRRRWRQPTSRDSGRYVARRPQAFGSELWCYAELSAGLTTRLLDLPLGGGVSRGCDEAWRLQAAIDAVAENPGQVRLRQSPTDGNDLVELSSPPPSWLQRRWDAIGTPTLSPGALFAYEFKRAEASEELQFVRETLWLEPE